MGCGGRRWCWKQGDSLGLDAPWENHVGRAGEESRCWAWRPQGSLGIKSQAEESSFATA